MPEQIKCTIDHSKSSAENDFKSVEATLTKRKEAKFEQQLGLKNYTYSFEQISNLNLNIEETDVSLSGSLTIVEHEGLISTVAFVLLLSVT